jgi:hypothetical protein
MDTFTRIQMAALATASDPSPAQAAANNYRKGRVVVHGLKIAIENARGTERKGTGADGKAWSNLMKNHYGHFVGFIGNDGDGVDVFIGAWPESKQVWIINQCNPNGSFDEHKVMLGFTDEQQARDGYLNSYSPGWKGLGSMIACTTEQLAWWLKYGNKMKEVTPESLPHDGNPDMKNTFDDAVELAKTIYAIRRDDPEGLAFDAITVDDILADSEGEPALDALVIEFVKVERKMGQMQAIMNAAGDTLQVSAVQVTPPFRQRGTTNVAGVFELSDGQTVSVFFHNPDVTPNRIAPQDELVSWKWMLNKKDITILVAPEKGDDLNAREVSRRIMKVAERNSARFAKANADKAGRVAAIEGMKSDIAAKEQELAALEAEIAELEERKESSGSSGVAAWEQEGFDPTSPEGYAILKDNESARAGFREVLDSLFQKRSILTNRELLKRGWEPAPGGLKVKGDFAVSFKAVSDMKGLVGSSWVGTNIGIYKGKELVNTMADDLTKTPEQIAAEVDAMVQDAKPVSAEVKAAAAPIAMSDTAFIQSVIDGRADLYNKAVTDKLADLARLYPDGSMAALMKQAKTAAKNFFMAEFQKKTAA